MSSVDIDDLYRRESRKVFATLVRLLGDFDLAEEATHEAFAAAMQQWPEQGTPANPISWLVSTGRFKAVDAMRRRARFKDLEPELAQRCADIESSNKALTEHEIEDDRLRLIFTCCHPAIDPKLQVPLTLREVCGLTTEEIARAFLMPPSTMAQRIVRGKAKIRDAHIPFVIPSLNDLPDRLESVLSVIYLVFNEAYSASSGNSLTRVDLSSEAIRLARLLVELLPDPEVVGLLALMLLHESRREARVNSTGDIILLEEQDRLLWDKDFIAEGTRLVEHALRSRRFGVYTIQAAISAVHAEAKKASDTDWAQIVALYDVLLRADSSPVVELNRAVAIAMRDDVASGLNIIDAILSRGDLQNYYLAHSARGEFLKRLGNLEQAKLAFERALSLTQQEVEQRFLRRKLAEIDRIR
ncbi:MAG: RNA polymerase sigma factor [Planctomyces sp.]